MPGSPPSWVRITLGPLTDGQARVYLRAAPSVLGVIAGLDPAMPDAGEWPALVEATLRRNPEVRVAEVLNEPEHFFGLSPERYVREFLQPAYERIRDVVPPELVFWHVLLESGDAYPGSGSSRQCRTPPGSPAPCPARGLYPLLVSGGRQPLHRRA